MANVIDYVELAVDDLAQAKAFYEKALGWAFNEYGDDYAGIKDPGRPGQEFGGLNPHPATSRGDGVLALVRSDDVEGAVTSVAGRRRSDPDRAVRVSRWTAVHVRRPVGQHPRGLPVDRVGGATPRRAP